MIYNDEQRTIITELVKQRVKETLKNSATKKRIKIESSEKSSMTTITHLVFNRITMKNNNHNARDTMKKQRRHLSTNELTQF
jgi:hypothetical protein